MDKLKDIKVKAIYQALISNDYPSRMSKSFIEKVMHEIRSTEKINFAYRDTLIRYASVFAFAVLTLYVLNYKDNNIEYSKSNIEITSPSQTENVVNQTDSCEDNKDLHTKEEKVCK